MHVWGRWYRDPNQPIPRTDITRFPHAVLEVKLSLPEGQTAPEWVTDLIESGYLTEVRRLGCTGTTPHQKLLLLVCLSFCPMSDGTNGRHPPGAAEDIRGEVPGRGREVRIGKRILQCSQSIMACDMVLCNTAVTNDTTFCLSVCCYSHEQRWHPIIINPQPARMRWSLTQLSVHFRDHSAALGSAVKVTCEATRHSPMPCAARGSCTSAEHSTMLIGPNLRAPHLDLSSDSTYALQQ